MLAVLSRYESRGTTIPTRDCGFFANLPGLGSGMELGVLLLQRLGWVHDHMLKSS